MKTLAELQAIRDKARAQIGIREEDKDAVRVLVGMATCGIAAGARPVLNAFVEEVAKRNMTEKVAVTQTGCIGICQYEETVSTPNTRSQCQHDATFFANPDYESVINQQQAEINARNAAAQPQTEE